MIARMSRKLSSLFISHEIIPVEDTVFSFELGNLTVVISLLANMVKHKFNGSKNQTTFEEGTQHEET